MNPNFEKIMDVSLLIFDTLSKDPEAEDIIEKIDKADDDEKLFEGIKTAVKRLEIFNPSVAKEIKKKMKGIIIF